MLRDLGLAAYAPTVVPKRTEPDLPDEVAIIAYASAERYSQARNVSLTGRLYTHTHRGVFNMDASGSVSPQPLKSFTSPVTGFALRSAEVDWQADGALVVYVGVRQDPSSTTFGQDVIGRLANLGFPGMLECIGQVSDSWAAIWFLVERHPPERRPEHEGEISSSDSSALEAVVREAIGAANLPAKEVLLAVSAQMVWRDHEPPSVVAFRGGSWTYVFDRAASQFTHLSAREARG
jgi:hypothetical protein